MRCWVKSGDAMVNSALRYVLSQDVATVIPGLKSLSEVETAAKAGEQYKAINTLEEQEAISALTFGTSYCRDCGRCPPCPQNLNVRSDSAVPSALMKSMACGYGRKNSTAA